MRILATALLLLALSGFAVPQNPHEDVPAEMQRAREALQNAKGELEHAGQEWGGHRVSAIRHVDGALNEIHQAEVWARQHHEMRH